MNAEQAYWVGLDVGGTKLLACVFDKDFKLVAMEKKKTRGDKGNGSCVERTAEAVRDALAQAKVNASGVSGIGVGVAGMLDLNRGVLLHAPNLGWKDVPLADELKKTFKVPAVLANDVDAGTYGEYRFGAARGSRCVVGVFPGTGIGGGCVYEGQLIRGKVGSCMEIGHMLMDPNGRLCGCGRRGCLETVASRLAISAEAASAAFRGDAPELLKRAGTDLADIRSRALADAIKAGDKAVEKIVRHAARQIGLALVSVVHLLAPDTVLLGGGLVEEMPDLFVEEAKDIVRTRAIKSFGESVRFVVAELGGKATAMGAAALAAEAVRVRSKG